MDGTSSSDSTKISASPRLVPHNTIEISTILPTHGDIDMKDESELSDGPSADGSLDGDFELEIVGDNPANGRSSSPDDRQAHKRKAGIEDNKDIMNNPELYGIRRSVRRKCETVYTTADRRQGRARQNAQIVRRRRRQASPPNADQFRRWTVIPRMVPNRMLLSIHANGGSERPRMVSYHTTYGLHT